MKPLITKVSKNVGKNPVAQAVARSIFPDVVRRFQIAIYTLKEGQNAQSEVTVGLLVLRTFLAAVERHGQAAPLPIRGAISALNQCADRNYRWYKIDTVSVDVALKIIVEMFPQLSPDDVAWAWRECS